jgi:hypothetical protein
LVVGVVAAPVVVAAARVVVAPAAVPVAGMSAVVAEYLAVAPVAAAHPVAVPVVAVLLGSPADYLLSSLSLHGSHYTHLPVRSVRGVCPAQCRHHGRRCISQKRLRVRTYLQR